jgi:hypothetical protein
VNVGHATPIREADFGAKGACQDGDAQPCDGHQQQIHQKSVVADVVEHRGELGQHAQGQQQHKGGHAQAGGHLALSEPHGVGEATGTQALHQQIAHAQQDGQPFEPAKLAQLGLKCQLFRPIQRPSLQLEGKEAQVVLPGGGLNNAQCGS